MYIPTSTRVSEHAQGVVNVTRIIIIIIIDTYRGTLVYYGLVGMRVKGNSVIAASVSVVECKISFGRKEKDKS